MKMVKTGFVFGLLVFCSVLFADAETEREAEKLLDTLGMQEMLEQSISQMLDIQLQQNPALVPYKGVMADFLNKHMSYEVLKPEIVKIYGDAFTVSELKEINAFYSTPAGRKTIEKMPTLMAQGAQMGAAHVQENIGELQEMIRVESERLQKLQQQ